MQNNMQNMHNMPAIVYAKICRIICKTICRQYAIYARHMQKMHKWQYAKYAK